MHWHATPAASVKTAPAIFAYKLDCYLKIGNRGGDGKGQLRLDIGRTPQAFKNRPQATAVVVPSPYYRGSVACRGSSDSE